MLRNFPCVSVGMKAAGVAYLDLYNTLKNSGTSFLLLPDGGIVDMSVSPQKWERTKSEAIPHATSHVSA